MSNGLEENEAHRCKGTTKSGKPCQAAATEGGLCYFHANPDKASECGRRGGRKNRRSVENDLPPLPMLDSAFAVQNVVERLIGDVYAGKVHPRIASGLAPLLNLQLRAIEATDLEAQVAILKKRLGEAYPEEGDALQQLRLATARIRQRIAMRMAREKASSTVEPVKTSTPNFDSEAGGEP